MVSSVFMAAVPLGVRAPGTDANGHSRSAREARAGGPFPVAGSDFRSGGGNRRADSSRGRDDDALATDLHVNHCSQDALICSTHIDGSTMMNVNEWERRCHGIIHDIVST
jgi:hypothetical protein